MSLASLRYSLIAAALLFSTASPAEVFDAALSQDTVRLDLSGPLSRTLPVNKGEYDLGGVYGEVEDFDKDNFFSGHAGLLLTGDAGATGAKVTAGLGARGQYVDGDGYSGGGLVLGGQLRAKLFQADRVRFNAYGYYGPDASVFGDIEEYTEVAVSIGFEVLRDAEIYVGYRMIEVEAEDGPDVDLEDGVHVGMRLEF